MSPILVAIPTVIDGRTNSTASIPVGSSPVALAMNRGTHNVFLADRLANTVTVISSAGAVTGTVPVGCLWQIGINGGDQ